MKELNYDSIDIAGYIINKCICLNYDTGYTKVQKLLYACYGVVLALFDARLTIEHPKAWQYGPAFPRAFSAQHKGKIDYKNLACIEEQLKKDQIKDAIDDTIAFFGKYTAVALVNWSHKPSSPWAASSNNGLDLFKNIPDELIKSYFCSHVLCKSEQD